MQVLEVDEVKLDQVSKLDELVLVDLWAPWCGPCRAIAPLIEEIADEYKGRLTVVKVNVDLYPEVALKLEISSIPTLAVLKKGQVVDLITHIQSKEDITKRLDALL